MSTPFLGEIRIFAGDFAPQGWALCAGQIVSVSQNSALFALLGTQYGGNGTSTFALPNLQGRAALSQGNSSTGTFYQMGEMTGTETVTLLPVELPGHNHLMRAAPSRADRANANNAMLAQPSDAIYASTQASAVLNPTSVGVAPGSPAQPHENMQPFLALNFIIALTGLFPQQG